MTDYKKAYLRRFIFIAIAVIILVLGMNLPVRWLSLTVVLISALVVLYHFNAISNLADRQIQEKAAKEEDESGLDPSKLPSPKRKQDIIYYLMMCLFVALFIPFELTGRLIENYIEWKPYIFDFLIYGGLISFLIAWVYYKKFQVIFSNKERGYYVVMWMFFVPLLMVFHATAWFNHLSPSAVIKKERMTISDRGENYRHGNKYLFLTINNKKTRFELPKYQFEKIKNEDTLLITVKKGALGYAYVDKFEIIAH